jgi:RNA recognition motif-containing protein
MCLTNDPQASASLLVETGRIFVANLPNGVTVAELQSFFEQGVEGGKVSEVKLVIKKQEENNEKEKEEEVVVVRNKKNKNKEGDDDNKKKKKKKDVSVALDPITSRTSAFITFNVPINALRAYQSLDGKTFQGRILRLAPALPPIGKGGDDKGGWSISSFGSPYAVGGASKQKLFLFYFMYIYIYVCMYVYVL